MVGVITLYLLNPDDTSRVIDSFSRRAEGPKGVTSIDDVVTFDATLMATGEAVLNHMVMQHNSMEYFAQCFAWRGCAPPPSPLPAAVLLSQVRH